MTDHPNDPEFFRQIASGIGYALELKDNTETERQRYRRANGATVWHESEPLVAVDPATLDGVPVPPRQWLVPDWVPMGRVTALYGAGGEGKTILGQMLATAAAIDALWLGQQVRRCNSLLLFCEDDLDEMHRRQDDINRYFGCTFSDLTAMRWLPRLGADNALMTFDGRPHRTPLFNELLHIAKEHNARLIITDTLADVFAGNESDRGQARTFAQAALGLLARETQGTVVALAHPSRWGINSGSGESGSTAGAAPPPRFTGARDPQQRLRPALKGSCVSIRDPPHAGQMPGSPLKRQRKAGVTDPVTGGIAQFPRLTHPRAGLSHAQWRVLGPGEKLERLFGMSLDDLYEITIAELDPFRLAVRMQATRVVFTICMKAFLDGRLGREASRERDRQRIIEELARREFGASDGA